MSAAGGGERLLYQAWVLKHGDRAGRSALQTGGALSRAAAVLGLAQNPMSADLMVAADARGYTVGPGRQRLFPALHKRE